MLKRIMEILSAALVVALVVGIYFRLAGSVPVSVTSTAKQSTFDVTGEGKVVVAPDQAEMTLGVRKESLSVAAATEQVDQAMQELSRELKKLGIQEKDIKTIEYNVYPSYDFEGRSPKGYTVNSSVQVVIQDIAKASEVVDLVGRMGLEQSGGLTFTLSESLRDKTLKQAREQAIGEAKEKAVELASLARMNLGRIVNIREGYLQPPTPYLMQTESVRDAAGTTPAQLEPGTSEVTVSVTLSYETR